MEVREYVGDRSRIGEKSLERDALRECGTWRNNRTAVKAGHSNMWLTVRDESRLQCSHERGNRLERM